MATYEQLIAAARQADQAGDEAAAKRFLVLAREAKGASAPQAAPQADGPDLNAMRAGAQARIDQDEATGANAAKWLNRAGETMTFGLVGDEAAGAFDAAIGRGDYDERRDFYRDQQKTFQQENPGAALSADVFGALVPGLGIAKTALSAPTLAGRVAKGGLAGGLGGGTFGFMGGEGGVKNRIKGATTGAAIGAAGGIAAPVAVSAVGAATAPVRRAAANSKWAKSVASSDDLKSFASRMYDRAERTGTTGDEAWTAGLAKKVRDVLKAEGLVAPSGRIHASAYPKVQGVLTLLDDFAKGPQGTNGGRMTVKEMQAVRRALQGVAKSADGSESRIGKILLEAFDGETAALAPDLRAAREAYSRAAGGETIEQAVELAGARAGQFSGSGFENALRTEFRALERQIIKGQLKGLSPDQVAAIRKVAQGGPIENFMRGMGRAAPSSIMNVTLGGGMPFLVGNAIGGPTVGAAAGAGTMAAGALGRRAATSMQTRNAEIAAALMRAGRNAKLPVLPSFESQLAKRLTFQGAPIGTRQGQ